MTDKRWMDCPWCGRPGVRFTVGLEPRLYTHRRYPWGDRCVRGSGALVIEAEAYVKEKV